MKSAGASSDTTPPTLTSVTAVNANTVEVLFSEPVAITSAQTPANYSIYNGVTITSAVQGADTRTVTLTTSALAGGDYLLTVNNLTDQANPPNTIAPGTQANFAFSPASSGSITFSSSPSKVETDNNNSASLTFAQAALSDGYILVAVSMYDPVQSAGITNASYGGSTMTLLGTAQSANAYTEVYLFGLAVGSKAAGNYSVSLRDRQQHEKCRGSHRYRPHF